VAGLNLVNARNQMEIVVAKKYWLFSVMCILMYFCLRYSIDATADVIRMQSKIQLHSQDVTVFTVELSMNGSDWASVQCTNLHNDGVQGACVFRKEGQNSEQVVASRFPHEAQARFLRILPEFPIAGGNLRLGVLGGVGKNNLDYQVVEQGPVGQVWVQHGCNNGSETDNSGRWVSRDERIGQVQCCLRQVSVCTRDDCLSSNNKTFDEAKALCEAKGWRLCTRVELNDYYSSGCCSSKYATSTPNLCGYDEKLVWTSNIGGNIVDSRGRLDSDRAMEHVKQVTVDLGKIRAVRGIQMQSGVPSPPFDGPACFFALYYLPFFTFWGVVTIFFSLLVRKTPLLGVQRGIIPWLLVVSLTSFLFLIVIYSDPSVPSVLSNNQICKSLYNWFRISRWTAVSVVLTIGPLVVIALYIIRPQKVFIGLFTFLFLGLSISFTTIDPHFSESTTLSYVIGYLLGAIGLPVVLSWLMKYNRRRAQKKTADDVQRYESAWADAGGCLTFEGGSTRKIHSDPEQGCTVDISVIDHLQASKEKCAEAHLSIQKGRERALAESSWIRSALGIVAPPKIRISSWARLLFWLGADGLGPYARTGKIRQDTACIDSLFDQAANLNDDFFTLLAGELEIGDGFGELCRGPVKRPDRALQKVVRRCYRDARCLTDLVRCCIVLESIADVRKALDAIFDSSTVHHGLKDKDNEHTKLLDGSDKKLFKICKVKDRFTDQKPIGYRDICFNLEVGWVIESETAGSLSFVAVQDFGKKHVRTHICEVFNRVYK